MGLPKILSPAKDALGSTLLGRLLGTADKSEEADESLSQLKFRLGEEPHTPRTGSPGFQDGHWVSLVQEADQGIQNVATGAMHFVRGRSDEVPQLLEWISALRQLCRQTAESSAVLSVI